MMDYSRNVTWASIPPPDQFQYQRMNKDGACRSFLESVEVEIDAINGELDGIQFDVQRRDEDEEEDHDEGYIFSLEFGPASIRVAALVWRVVQLTSLSLTNNALSSIGWPQRPIIDLSRSEVPKGSAIRALKERH